MGMFNGYRSRCSRCWGIVWCDGGLIEDHDCVPIWCVHRHFLKLVDKIYHKIMPK